MIIFCLFGCMWGFPILALLKSDRNGKINYGLPSFPFPCPNTDHSFLSNYLPTSHDPNFLTSRWLLYIDLL